MTGSRQVGGPAFHVADATLHDYSAVLNDKYRPPSRGGNTRAWHQHVLTIAGERYSFLAVGARKWVHAGDGVSFRWAWDGSGNYRNIDVSSLVVHDKNGKAVVRGDQGEKKWRTARTPQPSRGSERNDQENNRLRDCCLRTSRVSCQQSSGDIASQAANDTFVPRPVAKDGEKVMDVTLRQTAKRARLAEGHCRGRG